MKNEGDKETERLSSLKIPRTVSIVLVIVFGITAFILGTIYLPDGIDWRDSYRPAALALLSGESPYSVGKFYNAPWCLIPLLPFALLPEKIGRISVLLMGLVAFTYTTYKLGAKPIATIAFLLSPPIIHCLSNSNIEWMPILGFVLPPQIGLLFVIIKPQIGLGVGLFWLVESWQKGGLREIFCNFWPVTAALLLSFAWFGFWPLYFQDALADGRTFNASLWPTSIPVGIGLLAAAFHKRDIRYAMASSPCLSPFVVFHAWAGVLAAILTQPIETLATVAGLWILVIYRAFTGAT